MIAYGGASVHHIRFRHSHRQVDQTIRTVEAVDDLSLAVPPGEVFGFLGPNGAGKSTTIRLLLGLIGLAPVAQQFRRRCRDVRSSHSHLAYVPADVALWPAMTGAETLELLGNVGPRVDRGTARN